MLTPMQQTRLKRMYDLVSSGQAKIVDLDFLTNEIRRESPEKFHSLGVVSYGGECPPDNEESLNTRRFFDQPAFTSAYKSYVHKCPNRL